MQLTFGPQQRRQLDACFTNRHRQFAQAEPSGRLSALRFPPAAWKALLGPLSERAFTNRGQWSSRHQGAGTALRKIHDALGALEAHPAFKGVAVLEPERVECFTAFRDLTRRVTPYPWGACRLVVLEPERTEMEVDLGSGKVWVPCIRWVQRAPRPSDAEIGLFVDRGDHEGWTWLD